jgi:hypothetical protein
MLRKTWLTAAGVGGALVIGGSALVAVAASGPSDPGTTGSAPSASATSSPEGTPASDDTLDPTPSRDDQTAAPGSGQPEVSSEQAVEIARAALGGGGSLVVEEIDLEFEDGRLIWDVEFVGDHEVEVDSMTGDVVKRESGDGRDDDGRDDNGHDDDDDDGSGHGRGGEDDGPDHD